MHIAAHRLPIFFFGFTALFASAACSPGAGTPLGPEGGGAAGTLAPGGACEEENLTQACSCGASPGRQICTSGAWLGCECAAQAGSGGPNGPNGTTGAGGGSTGPGGGSSSMPTLAGNLRTDITFAWQASAAPVADGTCPPGQYEGNLQGWYWSILAPDGLAVPITNVDLPGAPSGFHFELSPAQGGEITQKVQGELDGLADALFPFKAHIEGELNCRTGTYTGHLIDGHYSILVDGLLPQNFDGVMSAHYDKRSHTFVNGIWDVKETSGTPPGTLAPTLPRDFKRDGFGGAGEYAAALPTDVTDPKLTTCPANFTCGAHLLGPNKLLCNNALGTPTCLTDADCDAQFPGEGVLCLKASLFSLCVRECKP